MVLYNLRDKPDTYEGEIYFFELNLFGKLCATVDI